MRLAEDLTRAGWTRTPELRAAFQVVPRQAFLPEQSLGRAYANEAVATVITASGQSSSSVSQPEMQAVMLHHGRLREGGHTLEIGGGGYNAALMAELVGATGTVTCVEYDPYVHRRTVRFLQETGYADRVRVVLGDGVHGAPEHLVPPGGFDTILVTVASMDVPPAWTAQLAASYMGKPKPRTGECAGCNGPPPSPRSRATAPTTAPSPCARSSAP
ncbi:hypothetical protein ACFTWD_11950 [Streptomyces sp. NPDC056943]|uniref:hypothetical protein n=1 Tax=Streptomyces sp. NPDC056943 TaxID=3345971 RepID=UPI00363A051D